MSLSPLELVHLLSSPSSSFPLSGVTGRGEEGKKSYEKDPLLKLSIYRESLERSSDHIRISESLYQRALANGIDEIVERFFSALAECEIQILGEESVGSVESRGHVDIRFSLRHFISVFPALDIYITDIISRNLYGGTLISSLYHRSQDGDEFTSKAFSALLWHTSQPFFGQIIRWMAHAEIDRSFELEGGKDFFIRRSGAETSGTSNQLTALVIASSITDGSVKAPNIGQHEVRVLASSSRVISSGKVPNSSLVLTDTEKGVASELQQSLREYAWAREYSLHYDSVPVPFITEKLAESVLAVGKAVSLLKFYYEVNRATLSSDSTIQNPSTVGFLLEDSFSVSELLESMRSSSTFSLVAAECVINRIQESVYNRLWSVLVHDSRIFDHVSSLRSFLLLGRGDFFQAFLELSRKTVMTTPATSPSILSILRTGPWEGAAALVNLRSEDFALPQSNSSSVLKSRHSEGTQSGHEAFNRVSLTICHRALRFEGMFSRSSIHLGTQNVLPGTQNEKHNVSEDQIVYNNKSTHLPGTRIGFCSMMPQVVPGELSSRQSQPINPTPRKSKQTFSSLLSSWTQPCSLNSAERIFRLARSPAQLLLLGSSSFDTYRITSDMSTKTDSNFSESDHNKTDITTASVAPSMLDRNITIALQNSNTYGVAGQHFIDRLVLSRPFSNPISLRASQILSSSKHVPTGATWMFQPVHVTKGFLLRASLGLGTNVATNNGIEQPASFAIVIHRDHALALGSPNSSQSTASTSGGYSGIQNSIAIHVLCKRIQSLNASPVFRIVVAMYGPPGPLHIGRSGGERHLIASSVMETNLQVEGACVIPTGSSSIDVVCRCLALSIEYLPPGSTVLDNSSSDRSVTLGTSGPPTTRVQLGSRGRIQVSVLEGAITGCLSTDTASEARRDSIAPDHSEMSQASPKLPPEVPLIQRVILDSPIVLDEVLNFAGVQGPGRGRAWVGLTSESSMVSFSDNSDPKSIISSPIVWVDALDFVSYSEADEGYLGLGLRYDAPWPLHLVIHSGSLSVYQDLFRFGLRVKSVALALQETWRLLTDVTVVDIAIGLRRGGGRITARIPAAEDGVSAQVTGRGGKRSDPTVRARDIQRRAAHNKLHALWLARSRLHLFVSALLYHLQVDVIECSYARFMKSASDAKSFGSLQEAHEDYLRSLLDGSGLLQPSVNACIMRLLSHCDRFVSLVSTHAQSDSLLALASSSTLSELSQVFEKEIKSFEQLNLKR